MIVAEFEDISSRYTLVTALFVVYGLVGALTVVFYTHTHAHTRARTHAHTFGKKERIFK